MNIVEKVRRFVQYECKKPASTYGYEPYIFHFVPMARYAGMLADELGGDKEIILIAAWLHDIGSIVHDRKDHHKTGAKVAERILRKFGYPNNKIAIVKRCIMNHRGSQNRKRHTIEECIIAEADTLSCFDNIAGLFKAALVYENLDQGKAKISVREKLERKWRQLHFKRSKELLKSKRDAILLLLG